MEAITSQRVIEGKENSAEKLEVTCGTCGVTRRIQLPVESELDFLIENVTY